MAFTELNSIEYDNGFENLTDSTSQTIRSLLQSVVLLTMIQSVGATQKLFT